MGQELWFNNSLPIGARTWYPTAADSLANTNGVVNPAFTPAELGSQVLRIFYQKQVTETKEGRLDGKFDFDDGRFQFGVSSTNTTMQRRVSETNSPLGDWGVANAGNEPGMVALLQPVSITGMFKISIPAARRPVHGVAVPISWRCGAEANTAQPRGTTRNTPQTTGWKKRPARPTCSWKLPVPSPG